jgi:hypothetical protein
MRSAHQQETTTRSHLLRQIHPWEFERQLIQKLGARCVAVGSLEASAHAVRFRMNAADGSPLELNIDRQQGIVTVTGNPQPTNGMLRIIALLDRNDTADRAAGVQIDLAPYSTPNFRVVNQMLQVIEQNNQLAATAGQTPALMAQAQNVAPQAPNVNAFDMRNGSDMQPVFRDVQPAQTQAPNILTPGRPDAGHSSTKYRSDRWNGLADQCGSGDWRGPGGRTDRAGAG